MRLLASAIIATTALAYACGADLRPSTDGGVLVADASLPDVAEDVSDSLLPDAPAPVPHGYHVIDGGSDGSRQCATLGTFEIQSCCAGVWCRGDCVQYDDASIGCNCFGIVGGCPAMQECCAKQLGCVADSVCLGTN